MEISKHFSLEEFCNSVTAINKGIDNTPPDDVVKNICALVEHVLEPLRVKYAKPIMINSGYRCKRLNNAVGGAKNSQHLTGKAADISGGSIAANKIIYQILKDYFGNVVDQCIDEYGMKWVHVSYNPNGNNRHQFFKIGK